MADNIELSVNGQIYTGWTEVKISRALNECASSFDIAVTERWAGQSTTDWQIKRGDSVVVTIGSVTVLTGFVEHYEPSFEAKDHTVRIAGRSKTCDIVDCMPDVTPYTYEGYKLDDLARGICSEFGIDVVVQGDVGDPFDTATIEVTETGHTFLEKLARLRSVILTDNSDGALVITQAGQGASAGSLIEGSEQGNILSGSAKLASNDMFSTYVAMSQLPEFDNTDPNGQGYGQATDANVTRKRRFVEIAENPLDDEQCTKRAEWRKLHNFAISTQATIVVQGFRQSSGGNLWDINQAVFVKSPRLGLNGPLLIGKVTFMFDSGGSRTELILAPKDAYTTEPDQSITKSERLWGISAPDIKVQGQ